MTRDKFPNNRVNINVLYLREISKRIDELTAIFHSDLSMKCVENTKDKYNNNVQIILTECTSSNSVFSNFFGRLEKMKTFRKQIKNTNYSVVHVRSGIIEAFIALYYQKEYSYIFSFHLSSLFFMIDRRNFKENRGFITFLKYQLSYISEKLLDKIIIKADIFFPVSEEMKLYYSNRNKIKNIISTPLCVDSNFCNLSIPETNKTSILYCGQMNEYRDSKFLIELFIKLSRILNFEFEFKLVGDISESLKEKFIKKSKLLNTKGNLVFQNFEYDNLAKNIIGSTIGISPRKPYEADICSSPSKVVEYMSLGIPVVANREIPDQYHAIKESKAGVSTSYSSTNFAKAIHFLLNRPKMISKMSHNGRVWVKTNRNYSNLSSDIVRDYSRLINE